MTGAPVVPWIEHRSADPEAALGWYAAQTGWSILRSRGYRMLTRDGRPTAGFVAGGAGWAPYLAVDDVDFVRGL
ncbi:MAG TPA: hypothetical protein PKA64_24125 [Myxococcota bacterium]|nr:hypothetical protein [Myxococcota bacterium]